MAWVELTVRDSCREEPGTISYWQQQVARPCRSSSGNQVRFGFFALTQECLASFHDLVLTSGLAEGHVPQNVPSSASAHWLAG